MFGKWIIEQIGWRCSVNVHG